MHNLPSNNETNIIRNIFNISTNFLNEQLVKTLDQEETAKAMRNAPGLGKDASGKFRPTADVRQQILMTPTTEVPQPRRVAGTPTTTPTTPATAPAAKPSSGLMGGTKPGSDFGGNRGIIRNAAGEIAGVETGLMGKAGKVVKTATSPATMMKIGKGLVRGVGIPLAVEYGVGKGLETLGMKGGAGQVETGRGMQPVESPGAVDYARDAIAGAAGTAAMGLGGANLGLASAIAGWNVGRAIAKKMGVDQEDRDILELGAEALGTSGSQHGRSQQLEKEQEAGEAARRARASDPEFLKKQAADKAARQAAAEEEKAAASKPAAPAAASAKEFALPASTLKPTENPLAGAASAKSAPVAKPATPAPASTRTPIMPGSSKEVIKTATSSPTAEVMKTIQDILNTPSATPAKPANKSLGGLGDAFGMGTTDSLRSRTDTAINKFASPTPTTKPATPAKLPEQPMDRAVKQFRNRQEEEKGAQPLPEPAKGAYESGQEVPEAEWKARQAKAQASYNDARAKKAGYKDYAQYQQMQDESAGLQKTAEAQQARLAELKKQNLVSESYYRRLANLFEETRVSDQPISGVNPAAYGYTPKGQRKARLAAQGFAEPMKSWAGDSTTEAPDLEPESTERPHIDTVVAPHINTLIGAAVKNDIDLSHGEAFNPGSRDHQRLIIKTKDPAVMKASEAIRQIRKDYGMED